MAEYVATEIGTPYEVMEKRDNEAVWIRPLNGTMWALAYRHELRPLTDAELRTWNLEKAVRP
jgi:hypothetical protein